VLSIIALTRRRATSLDSFADSLEGRIRALSATHDLLTQSEWGATPIRAIVKAEMAPYAQDAERHLVLDGPDVDLAPNDALSLGLAIHELATNAAKYGALSVEDGQVSVRWAMAADNLARIEWQERGGPAVSMSGRRERGFGTDLIEKIVAHELRNPVDLRFDPEGVLHADRAGAPSRRFRDPREQGLGPIAGYKAGPPPCGNGLHRSCAASGQRLA
jgi:two-component sensor histidine kinase